MSLLMAVCKGAWLQLAETTTSVIVASCSKASLFTAISKDMTVQELTAEQTFWLRMGRRTWVGAQFPGEARWKNGQRPTDRLAAVVSSSTSADVEDDTTTAVARSAGGAASQAVRRGRRGAAGRG